MASSTTVNKSLVAQGAHSIAQSLRARYGQSALQEFYKLMRRRDQSTSNGLYAVEEALNELEHRLLLGAVEALLCYYHDLDNFGGLYDTEAPVQTMLVGIGEAERICRRADIVRQRIQDLCDKGRLPWVEDPYHGRKLVVRKAIEELARNGNPDYR